MSTRNTVTSNIPIPDPSLMTMERLHEGLDALEDKLTIRLDGMDKATSLRLELMAHLPEDMDKQVGHLRDVQDEKFSSIQKQFEERDIRSRASEDAAKVAVNAALQAQKEAAGAQNESNDAKITKSEAATVKQIDSILNLLASNTKASDEKISSINQRLDRNEGNKTGTQERTSTGNTHSSTLIAVIALMVTIVMMLFNVFGSKQQPAPIMVSPPATISSPTAAPRP